MTAPEFSPRQSVRLHYTNIGGGLGAMRLLQSLLPAMAAQPRFKLETLYVPGAGELEPPTFAGTESLTVPYSRVLPNSISRFLECTLFGSKFSGISPLLVLGDIPLRIKSRQTVFVQTGLLLHSHDTARKLGSIKYIILRALFKYNQAYASSFIVQTEWMKAALIASYPKIAGRVYVVGQPAPHWVAESGLRRAGPVHDLNEGLRLFYPAASYPHKNHKLWSGAVETQGLPISELVFTLPNDPSRNFSASFIRCVGQLEPSEIVAEYARTDALFFLSLAESFGLPLIEAMTIGLPIVCPDLEYAHAMCGENAIYFDPYDLESAKEAIRELNARLTSGWWPDWSESLKKIPANWNVVAKQMLQITVGSSEIKAGAKSK